MPRRGWKRPKQRVPEDADKYRRDVTLQEIDGDENLDGGRSGRDGLMWIETEDRDRRSRQRTKHKDEGRGRAEKNSNEEQRGQQTAVIWWPRPNSDRRI